LTNVFNFSLLCFYVERHGIPTSWWFKAAVIEVTKTSELNLDINNLEFYVRFATKDSHKKVSRTRLLNAAYTTTRDLSGKAEVYNRILEQGLIVRAGQEDFKFASPEIRKAIKRVTEIDLVKYQQELIVNKLVVRNLIKLRK
jgi:hypothetical protein